MLGLLIVLFVFVFISALLMSLKIVPEATTMVIERLGKYHKTLKSGINIVIPFIDVARQVNWSVPHPLAEDDNQKRVRIKTPKIDLREQIYDYPKQSVITKDNVSIEIDALIYFQIMDAKRAVYEVSNLPKAIEMLTQTTLRNVLGAMELDESLTSRDSINIKLCTILDEATDKWGVKVNRVEIKDITPPPSIQEIMEKQMKAEREKRAEILLAEGDRQASILRAEGEAEAIRKKAEAEAGAIASVKAQFANETEYAEYLKAIRYIDAMKEIFSGKEGKTIFMPYETQKILTGVGAISELLNPSITKTDTHQVYGDSSPA